MSEQTAGLQYDGVAGPAAWVVVPAYNEVAVIGETIRHLVSRGWRVLVVDDGSTDGTGQVAAQEGAVVVTHAVNRGQGAAIVTGWIAARQRGAAIVATFDGDGQHDADDLPAVIAPVANGLADVCIGSRFTGSATGMPWGRRLLLRVGAYFTRMTTGLPVTDTQIGIRALDGAAVDEIRLVQDRMAYASELFDEIARLKLRLCEVPVRVRYSEYSLSKGQRNRDVINVVADYLGG